MKKKNIKEIKQNELISNGHEKACKILNYTVHLLILASRVSGFVSTSAFASLAGIAVGIPSSAATIKNCAKAAGIKMYKSIIKKKNNYMIRQYS